MTGMDQHDARTRPLGHQPGAFGDAMAGAWVSQGTKWRRWRLVSEKILPHF